MVNNISSLKPSTKTLFLMSSTSSVSIRSHTFLSQFMMSMMIIILLIGFCPYVSSSPTPSSIPNDHNNMNYESNGFIFNPSDFQTASSGDALLSSSSPVQHSLSGSSPFWYIEPRLRANQFLLKNENEIFIPKWYDKYSHDDDLNDYIPSNIFFNKRSSNNHGGYSNIKKRKQLTKPPMEVMNEIVNSIYLKR